MRDVPLIDLAPLVDDPRDSSLDHALAEAFSTTAGLLVGGFPGASELAEETRKLTSFFALPETVKRDLAARQHVPKNSNIYRGFTPLPTRSHWAYNEIFDMGPEPPLPAPGLPSTTAFEEPNVWPPEAAAPGWRAAMNRYGALSREIISLVLPATLRGLGLPGSAADHLIAGRNGVLRLLHYPLMPDWFEMKGAPAETDDQGRALITMDHIDTGVLSVLWQDDAGGLQMQGRDAVWREVPKLPGTLSVHCGDLLAPIAGAAMAGTHHRVMGGRVDRCSIGFFGEPDFTTLIEAPDGKGQKTYGQHLTDMFPTRFLEPA